MALAAHKTRNKATETQAQLGIQEASYSYKLVTTGVVTN